MSGFQISLKDGDSIPKPICTFPAFSLDATGMIKQTLTSSSIVPSFYYKGSSSAAS